MKDLQWQRSWTPEDRATLEDIFQYCSENGVGLGLQEVHGEYDKPRVYLNFMNTGNQDSYNKLYSYVKEKFNA